MKSLFTVYRLLFTVNREWVTGNLWKTDNRESLTGGVYE